MTRLIERDVENISGTLDDLDRRSRETTGATIEELARETARCFGTQRPLRTAVIPITAGLGLIGGFNASCRAILEHCGADAFITEATDVAGIQEAYRRGAELLFIADDDVCTMVSTEAPVYSDNGHATGRAFAVALEHMIGEEEVLVLGAGPVGLAALQYLSERGFKTAVYDVDREKGAHAAALTDARFESDPTCFRRFDALLDATNAGGFITVDDVSTKTCISAPGMPLCLTQEAARIVHLFHNPLELGVTTMYFDCVRQLAHQEEQEDYHGRSKG